nr:MAG TPA: Head fiber protein [Caudoviricetes sp.]
MVTAESDRAKIAEKANTATIEAEVERAKAAESVLNDKIDVNGDEVKSESDRAQAAESALDTKIETEITRATNAESVLKTKIETDVKTEADRAKAEESRIEIKTTDLVSAETERAKIAEKINADTITAVDTAYKAADATLDTKIDTLVAAEVSRAKAAEKVNSDAIITEKDRAIASENVIRNGLNDEIGRAQAAEQANTTAITTEVTRSKAEEIRIETKFDGFVSNLDSKINTNKTAIEAEVERATTAEALTNKNLNDEVLRAKDAEKINSDSIANEVVRATVVEKVIADDLNAEIIRAKSVEKANNDTINAEAERAKAAEVNIDGKLTIEVARATKAEEDFAVLLAGTSGSTSYSNIKTELDKLGDNYNSIRSIAVTLKNFLNSGGVSDAIDSFKELQGFLAGITDSQTLAGLLLELKNEILGGAGDDTNTLKKVYDALSGNTGGDVDLSNYYTKSETDSKDNTKVDKVSGKGLSTNDFTTAEKSKLASLSNYDDSEIRNLIGNTYTKSEVDAKIDEAVAGGEVDLTNYYTKAEIDSKVSGKVDKVTGKGLSTNDFTTALKTKLEGLTNYDDSDIRTSITNIQNMVDYTLIEKTVSGAGVLTLSNDRLQHSVITRNTTITLPTVNKYTVIDLSFTANSNYTVTFPSTLIWKSAPSEFKDGVEMEFIFTYNNNKWYSAYIEYGNN